MFGKSTKIRRDTKSVFLSKFNNPEALTGVELNL